MKGLLVKDFYCLRKQYGIFLMTIIIVFVISIMFVFSCKYGNINKGFESMVKSGMATGNDISYIARIAMAFCFLIPMALTGNVMELFVDDRDAGFGKLAGALPVSIRKRVMSRFISGMIFTVIGCMADIIMAAVLSRLTDIITFKNYFAIIITFASLMIMYLSFLILYAYILGTEKMTLVAVLPLITGVVAVLLVNMKRLIGFIHNGIFDADIIKMLFNFIMNKSHLMFVASLVILAASYLLCVHISDLKRGVI